MRGIYSSRDGDENPYFLHRQTNLRHEHDDKWEEFLAAFQELLDPESSTGLSVAVFLSNKLHQFKLNGFFSHADILNEVLLRAHKLIHREGVTILQPAAWVRKTGFYVICELSRKEQKSIASTEDILEKLDGNLVPQEVLTNDFITINLALALLEPHEQRLLQLKLIDCLAWHDIWEIFRDEGYDYTQAALRKKKERILKKLRYYYHALMLEHLGNHDSTSLSNRIKLKQSSQIV